MHGATDATVPPRARIAQSLESVSQNREQALRVLRRVVAQQIPWLPTGKEVQNEQR